MVVGEETVYQSEGYPETAPVILTARIAFRRRPIVFFFFTQNGRRWYASFIFPASVPDKLKERKQRAEYDTRAGRLEAAAG